MRRFWLVFVFLLTTLVASEKEILTEFLETDTERAREMLRQFSDKELLDYYNQYLEAKNLKERRYLWLIEEYYHRQADRTAQERLIYLFLALLLLFTFIALYSVLSYRRIVRITKDDDFGAV
ncbi:MAG: hypothetical protein NZM25_04555 [Leptospiraceae bacterium]|nr:hypothetical protein [Leptospiraceae bacterium]MDW8305716.1 hypothetical protein [Leptospiraceae bacterium]